LNGIKHSKVGKAVGSKLQNEMDKHVHVAGDGKEDFKHPVKRFISNKWTNHLTRNGKQRTFANGGIDPIAVASVTIESGTKQQVSIDLPKIDAVRSGDSVYLAVFVTDGDSSVVGSAAWRERLSKPDAAYFYDISTDTNCKLSTVTSDIEDIINSGGDFVHKMDDYTAKMQQ
jgi:hypothetical protein